MVLYVEFETTHFTERAATFTDPTKTDHKERRFDAAGESTWNLLAYCIEHTKSYDENDGSLILSENKFFGVVEGNETDFQAWDSQGTVSIIAAGSISNYNTWSNQVFRETDTGAADPQEHYDNGLAVLKAKLYDLVDVKTRTLIAAGFEYPATSGQMFSTSANAQMNWMGLYTNRANWTYPKDVKTVDEIKVSLAAQADVESFFDAGITFLDDILVGGVDVKQNIKNAADAAAAISAYEADAR